MKYLVKGKVPISHGKVFAEFIVAANMFLKSLSENCVYSLDSTRRKRIQVGQVSLNVRTHRFQRRYRCNINHQFTGFHRDRFLKKVFFWSFIIRYLFTVLFSFFKEKIDCQIQHIIRVIRPVLTCLLSTEPNSLLLTHKVSRNILIYHLKSVKHRKLY